MRIHSQEFVQQPLTRIMFFTLEERFQTLQHDFKEKYYHHFTDEEENKLIYMDIFKEYVSCSITVQFLPANTVLCPWARHLILTVPLNPLPLSTQVYKWVLGN